MMRFSLVLAALAACSSAASIGRRHGVRRHKELSLVEGRSQNSDEESDAVYRPINVVTSRATGSIEARDTMTFTNIDPADRAHMVFGKAGSNGEIHLADMMLYADTDLPIVMMEAFEGLTSAVDCDGRDGQMSLTFGSSEAFNHAIDSWSYIHEDTDRQFIMIANHDSCGPEGQRQAYKITDIDNDEANNVVYLSASPAGWSEIAGSFDMEFGKVALTRPATKLLRARGVLDIVGNIKDKFDDAKDAVEDTFDVVGDGIGDTVDDIGAGIEKGIDGLKDGIENGFDGIQDGIEKGVDGIQDIGDGDISESVTIPLSVGEENVEKVLFEDFTTTPPTLILSCTSCFVNSKFETTGSLKVQDFKPETLVLDVAVQDFSAAVELKAEISQKNPDFDALSWEKTIVEAPIPGAGIVVPGIFSLGATAALKIQGTALVFGVATVSFGARTSIPNGSKVSIDLVDPGNSSVSGFETASVEPIFDVDQASLTATLLAGPQPALTLGVEVLDNTGIEAELAFGTPKLSINATAGFDENGFCSPSDPITSGIETVSAANFDMFLSIGAELGGSETPLFNRKLVNIPIATFLDECFPIKGVTPPKLTGTGGPTDVPGTTTGAPSPSGTVDVLSRKVVSPAI